jgi:predicted dehydrogenase
MHRSTTRRDFLQQTARLSVVGLGAAAWPSSPARAALPAAPKIKIGQIGTGHVHASKLDVYRRSADYEVVGVVEPDPQLRARAEQNALYRDLTWMTQEQLLNQQGLEAVLVETGVRDLLHAAQHCIDAGKHVHLDVPAGESLAQFKKLLRAAAERSLLIQMGYMFRYNPAVALLQKFLQEGWLGEIFEAHAVMSKIVPPNDRLAMAKSAGGVMFERGCYVVDLLVGALGKPDRVRSVARHSSPQPDKLLDSMLAVCEYPKAIATIKSSALEVDGAGRRHVVVCGTAGTLQIEPLDAPKVRYSLDRDRGEYLAGTHEIPFGPYDRFVGDAADMVRIIRGEKKPDFSYEHDLAVQETILLASGMPTDT